MFYRYLAARGQAIMLINCTLAKNHVDCGCALFFTKNPQRLYYGTDIINDGRKLLLPKNIQIETYTRLTDINNNIRLFFESENINE